MKRFIIMPIVAACMCCMAACSNSDKITGENGSKADEYDDIPEEYLLSSRFTPEQIDSLKRMSRVIYSHLRITEDSIYALDLTEEEAIKAGVDKKFYEDAVESINSTNEMLLETRKIDGVIEGKLLTPEELLEAVDNAR